MKKSIIVLLVIFPILLFAQEKLDEVQIKKEKKALSKSLKSAANTTVVSSKELLKAACCNLAESFETNPSIDVNFSDAITGTKQIKMLGLTSPYILISEENIPIIRGASQVYGLSFTPGTWVESIQITKGAGSVVNGYESISGQINTELIKPKDDIPFFLNTYAGSDSRFEINTHFNKKINPNWATSLFVHGNTRVRKNDMNNDGFMDNPLAKQINLSNRWQYTNAKTGWVSFINFKLMKDEKQTGELRFDPKKDRNTTNAWGSEINTNRIDFSSKIGYVFKDMPFQSIGFQNAYSNHNQQSYFGTNKYDIREESFYGNLIFNSIINNTSNKFSTGLNFTYDDYTEFVNLLDVSRKDNSVGTFFEYTYDNTDDFSIILGGRLDIHNRLGTFFTPRLHARYNLWKAAVVKFSAGRGKRLANIFAENQNYFASSRTFTFKGNLPSSTIFGKSGAEEIAWNYGLSLTQKFQLFAKNANFTIDFYRTNFEKQAVIDLMESAQRVVVFDLQGQSFANSLQVDFNLELKKHFDLRTAYKYFDVQTDYTTGRFQRPLQAKHRVFANLEYATHIVEKGRQWKFDFTYNWLGKQQLPNTANNPTADQLGDFAPSFSTINSQITRTFSSVFEMYVGGENMTNYQQQKAILGASNPFGPTFDTSIAYAPIFGQMYYFGLRYKVK